MQMYWITEVGRNIFRYDIYLNIWIFRYHRLDKWIDRPIDLNPHFSAGTWTSVGSILRRQKR